LDHIQEVQVTKVPIALIGQLYCISKNTLASTQTSGFSPGSEQKGSTRPHVTLEQSLDSPKYDIRWQNTDNSEQDLSNIGINPG
jgi:hypothetical protein